ncbi:L,D-transpeptidase family protein [Hymenobacter caeli]|uniref:Murein L,D-transpeptidase YcbB/YkuD n=1 Tax=Hymenobacter caeli TaxID=2735894 RepID=A0ABX2FQW4_9BACT|nr:L,D-transpeptidase family protein [Hymenobacter caeli]NRT19568.1 murein L,D-transpeptidase YcbB/YkuD [Hymenobacter caeli]
MALLAHIRLLSGCIGLLLATQCGAGAPPAGPQARPLLVAKAQPTQPVDAIIRALLDTAAAGRADERLGLQAGAEVRAFYGTAGAPAWLAADSLGPDAAGALALLAQAPAHGLRPADYGSARLLPLRDSLARPGAPAQRARQLARLDVYLSDAVLRFMRDVGRGRLHRYVAAAGERAAGPAGQPGARLRAALGAHAVPAAMLAGQPANREYRQLQQALARWLALPSAPDSAGQHRARYEQVALNLERWRWEALPAAAAEYVLVNLPACELLVVAHDSVLRRHRLVVGKPATPTPTLSSVIDHFTLAPDWHVPRSIATREILPRLKRDAGYLARNNYALYDGQGRLLDARRINWAGVTAQHFPYTIRQSAGCDNALGNIVFRFANPYSVYVHDTPERQVFAQPYRALSHGCMRLEQPMQLAAYLLRRGGQPVQLPSEAACARQPRPRDVPLRRPIPLFVRYATCTAERGQLRFLPDIYHRDETIRRGLFGPEVAAGPQ